MLEMNVIPPTISLKTLNPRISSLDNDHVVISSSATSWVRTTKKRLALLNNFGASGSNATLLLEDPPETSTPCTETPLALIGVSADTLEALEALRASYVDLLGRNHIDDQSLSDISYTCAVRRRLYRYRLSVAGHSCHDLARKLEVASIIDSSSFPEKTVFVFSGQGSQYLGMGADLYRAIPKFRKVVDECHSKLLSWNYPGVLHVILNHACPLSENAQDQSFETAVFVIEYAIATLWMSWSIQPDILVGHRYVLIYQCLSLSRFLITVIHTCDIV